MTRSNRRYSPAFLILLVYYSILQNTETDVDKKMDEGEGGLAYPGVAVAPHKLALREDVPLNRGLERHTVCLWRQVEHRVERVEFKKVAMGARGRARAAPASPSKTGYALCRSGRSATLRNLRRAGRDIPHRPMHPRASGSVRVVAY